MFTVAPSSAVLLLSLYTWAVGQYNEKILNWGMSSDKA